jgi:hypothetical protein
MVKTEIEYNQWKAKNANKVLFKPDYIIEPLIDNGNAFGRIIGEKRQFRIGKNIIQYWEDKVISIPDGDNNKVEIAKQTLRHDPLQGILIHDLKIRKPEDLQSGLNVRGTCPNTCPSYAQLTQFSGKFRLRVKHDVIDNSYSLDRGPYCLANYYIKFDVSLYIEVSHEKKQLFYYVADRSGFTFTSSWDMERYTANGANGNAYGSRVQGGTGWSSDLAFVNYSTQVFNSELCSGESNYHWGDPFRCIHKITVIATSNTGITTGINCQR